MNDNQKKQDTSRPARFFAGVTFPSIAAHLIFWPIVIAGVWLDLWSKQAAFQWLGSDPTKAYPVIDGFFDIVNRVNDGAAFSIASGQRTILVTVSIVALVIMIGIFIFGSIRSKTMIVAFALFTAGIIGNLYDRVFNYGFVRDFLDIYVGDHHWPAFNAADSMLCIAVGLLIICNIISEVSQRRDSQQKTEP